ncbi:MAG: nuclear transport factor 2 family protein [Sphingomonadales bacterium]|nr:nuclear transport factor 2 family protein [Sphingomonadales bacterium]
MDDVTRLLIERDCARLPLLFAKYADKGDHAALADLFTEDCEFARPFQPDHPFFGRDRVQAIFRDRPPLLVRHIVTNILIDVENDELARGTNYVAMLSNHHNIVPPQEAAGLFVGEFEDVYVLTSAGWRFRSRRGRVALHHGGSMPNMPPPSDEARGLK